MIGPARLMVTLALIVCWRYALSPRQHLSPRRLLETKTCVLAYYQAAETDGRATRVNAPLLRFSCAFDSVSKSTVNAWIGARTSAL